MKISNRIYNILFHTHTVSGILISVGLYVIFFAGSFSFFRDEIISWERNEPVKEISLAQINLNEMMDTLNQRYETYGKDVSFNKSMEVRRITVNLSASKDTTAAPESSRGNFFYMDTETYKTYDYTSNYSIGEFLYRLHFLAQLNLYGSSGYFIAGIIAFFFLFAVITGVIVHWNKIISNFYLFRPSASLKNIWTDAHTALGIIGLPYQFVYAVTGVFLIIGTTIMSPAVLEFIYKGDTDKMYQDYGYKKKDYPLAMIKQKSSADINGFVAKIMGYWPDLNVKAVNLYNYGDANMYVGVTGSPKFSKKFTGEGELIFNAQTQEIVYEKDAFESTSYLDGASGVITRLHFGDFGGRGFKVVYFVLGIITCFVIISGVLIWLVARNKKHITEKKRKFNNWVGWIYLAVCLTLYPVTAFTFLAVKLFVMHFDASRMTSIYHIFFYTWLVLIILFTLKKDNFFTNKYSLLLGALLGFMVPVANGLVSGNWIWHTYLQGHDDIFFIDAFWLVISSVTFIVVIGLKRKDPDSPLKTEIDLRKNIYRKKTLVADP